MATPTEQQSAPEWLHKLESRREKIRNKLGHEIGRGSLCLVCGPSCPGLDLHFWRKICINCKCRKEQHDCPDDDMISGWAQFEILGAIRSKPVFMKISKLAEDKLKLDWVPPNIPADLVNDYMSDLNVENIPISGSDAAAKRKEQLEFQVPPHDLDASLCHNLSTTEAEQLQQYVDNIKENCSGQANVIRMGKPPGALPQFTPIKPQKAVEHIIDNNMFRETPKQICRDKTMFQILNSEVVQNVLQNPARILPGTEVLTVDGNKKLDADFMHNPYLTDKNKYKLKNMAIDSDTIQSALENRDFYDRLLEKMNNLKVKFDDDPVLGAIDRFRKEYLANDAFRKNINEFADQRALQAEKEAVTDVFHSPLPLKQVSHKQGGQLMHQETPMRKIKFDAGGPATIRPQLWDIYDDNGMLLVPTIQRDPILLTVLNSDVVKGILQNPSQILAAPPAKLQICGAAVSPDFMESPHLMDGNKEILKNMHVNNQMIHSALQHPIVYDKLFADLDTFKVNYADDTVLAPMKYFTEQCRCDPVFHQSMREFGNTLQSGQLGEGLPLYSGHQIKQIIPSKSNDSGFGGSIPPTPNFATYPGSDANPVAYGAIDAIPGHFTEIPGIADMNMYPEVAAPNNQLRQNPHTMENLVHGVGSVSLNDPAVPTKVPVLKCKECQKSIMLGDVAVKAERAGSNAAWHPSCFKCHSCSELLADLVYFFHDGHVYCARDLAKILQIPRCKACDELIFTKEYTAAEGATFHVKHFCCFNCDTALAGSQYIPDEKSKMPLCLKCYDEFFAEQCQSCNRGIGPQEQGVAWGEIHWHGQCFLCAGQNCSKNLLGGRFCVKNKMPFCSPQCVKSIIF